MVANYLSDGGRGKSINALAAEDNGIYPLTTAKSMLREHLNNKLMISEAEEILRKTHSGEWHHVGKYATECRYYSISDAIEYLEENPDLSFKRGTVVAEIRAYRQRQENHRQIAAEKARQIAAEKAIARQEAAVRTERLKIRLSEIKTDVLARKPHLGEVYDPYEEILAIEKIIEVARSAISTVVEGLRLLPINGKNQNIINGLLSKRLCPDQKQLMMHKYGESPTHLCCVCEGKLTRQSGSLNFPLQTLEVCESCIGEHADGLTV